MDGALITNSIVALAGIAGTATVAWRSRVAADKQLTRQLGFDAAKQRRASRETAYTDALANQWHRMMWLDRTVLAVKNSQPLPEGPDDDWGWAQMSARLTIVGSSTVRDTFGAAMTAISFAARMAHNARRNRELQVGADAIDRSFQEMFDARTEAQHQGDALADAIRDDLEHSTEAAARRRPLAVTD